MLDKTLHYCYYFYEGMRMKNYFYKYVYKGLIFVLFSVFALPLLAANFNEERRVILSQNINAVYRDLLVLGKMELNVGSHRKFWLEIGKRPTYFWNKDNMFYLFQKQELNVAQFVRTDSTEISYPINNITILGAGSFSSKGLLLNESSDINGPYSANLRENANLLLNLPDPQGGDNDDIKIKLNFPEVKTYNFYSKNFYVPASTSSFNAAKHVRDVCQACGGSAEVKFVSPRMMIYDNGGYFTAQGTALRFENVDIIGNSSPKHYYGPWELWGPMKDGGRLSGFLRSVDDDGDVCVETEDVCEGDNNTSTFSCDSVFDETTCYDYQEVNIRETFFDSIPVNAQDESRLYNDNQAHYEFKVEEAYQLYTASNSAELVSQKPKIRVTIIGGTETTRPISSYTTGGWIRYNVSNNEVPGQRIYINGELVKDSTTGAEIQFSNNHIGFVDSNEANPCFTICDGKLCDHDYIYVRTPQQRELKGGDDAMTISAWPNQEGAKQDLIIRTYTVGYCPAKRSDYNQYEKNNSGADNLIDALKIKTDNGWGDAKVCMRRKVKCNKLSEPQYYQRTYRPLSTDH